MKPLMLAMILSGLLSLPVAAAEGQADPTGAVTDTPNPVPADRPEAAETAPEDCNTDDYADWLGQPGTAVESMTFERPVRVIPEGSAVTMDFLPYRVNFKLDADGRVAEITCG